MYIPFRTAQSTHKTTSVRGAGLPLPVMDSGTTEPPPVSNQWLLAQRGRAEGPCDIDKDGAQGAEACRRPSQAALALHSFVELREEKQRKK